MGRITNDPKKMCSDLTDEILRMVFELYDKNSLSSWELRTLTEEINEKLNESLDIGEEAFNAAFYQGREEGMRDMREDILDDMKTLGYKKAVDDYLSR